MPVYKWNMVTWCYIEYASPKIKYYLIKFDIDSTNEDANAYFAHHQCHQMQPIIKMKPVKQHIFYKYGQLGGMNDIYANNNAFSTILQR